MPGWTCGRDGRFLAGVIHARREKRSSRERKNKTEVRALTLKKITWRGNWYRARMMVFGVYPNDNPRNTRESFGLSGAQAASGKNKGIGGELRGGTP